MNKKIIIFLIVILLLGICVYGGSKLYKNEVENEDKKQEKDSSLGRDNGEDNMKIKVLVNSHELIIDLVDNSSTRGLIEKLEDGPITIDMEDYNNMEKVGELGISLPRNDENISTDYGDVILYLGSRFVIYYDKNNWDFTRLGKVQNITKNELKEILGKGNISVTISKL